MRGNKNGAADGVEVPVCLAPIVVAMDNALGALGLRLFMYTIGKTTANGWRHGDSNHPERRPQARNR